MLVETFEIGQHVIVETDDGSIAGYLADADDDGIVLKVTHKMRSVEYALSDSVKGDIHERLLKLSTVRLKVMSVASGVWGAWRMSREELLEIGQGLVEAEILKKAPEPERVLTALKAPIMTFLAGWTVKSMEVTDDRNMDARLTNIQAELDGLPDE